MTTPFTIPHDADTISNAITKVVNSQSIGTLASNANLADNSVIKNYVDAQIASSLASQLSDIKAGFRPKFAPFGSGTYGRWIQNPSKNVPYTYQINAFAAPGAYTDFNYTKITHLVVDCFVRNAHNYIELTGTLPDGQYARLARTAAYGGGDDVEDASTTLLPINPGQSTVSFKVNYHTYGDSFWDIRGFMYLPGLD